MIGESFFSVKLSVAIPLAPFFLCLHHIENAFNNYRIMAEVIDPQIETGSISVHTENIFPIIKKSLYSDHEIFVRELVSNAVDASQKLKHLADIGQYKDEVGDLKVVVTLDPDKKTITISDRGLGMSADEVRKYINQVAFSGAEEFVKKFKDLKDKRDTIIGQFGLGFYSAFMVSSQVEIDTRSYKKNTGAVHWTCDGSTTYTLDKSDRKERGTDVVLHVAEDSEEFLEKARIKTILNKYCKFLPIPVEFDGEVINKTEPLWKKKPADIQDSEYLEFFNALYPYAEEPLFWIHLNVDYPFELTGILYFPKLRNEGELKRDRIHLYSRQVFITDNVENIVPDYLGLLQGVIDSPDIPLNVSRSYLQTDANVRKISTYISKKVADKLKEIFNEDREKFVEKWKDIEVFAKYGMLSDEKFYDKAEEFALLKNVAGEHYTLKEYKEKIAAQQTDKDGTLVYVYASDPDHQDSFIQSAHKKGYDVLHMGTLIDAHFIGFIERKLEKATWKRVDSESIDKLIAKDATEQSALTEEQNTAIVELYKKVAGDLATSVRAQALGADENPVVLVKPEFMRRMREQAMLGGMGREFKDMVEVVVNTSHSLATDIVTEGNTEAQEAMAQQLLDLARLSQGMLSGKELTEFIARSVAMVGK
jgi:molecular chaperone HtpG